MPVQINFVHSFSTLGGQATAFDAILSHLFPFTKRTAGVATARANDEVIVAMFTDQDRLALDIRAP